MRSFSALIVLTLALVSCGNEPEQVSSAAPAAPVTAQTGAESPSEQPLSPPPATSLKPLPTVNQVQAAVVDGRRDPFQPLNNAVLSLVSSEQLDSGDPSASDGVSLRGVLSVGGLEQALVQTAAGSGAVCVGPGGRCPGDAGPDQLLPAGWSVLAIDLNSGCLTLANSGQPQSSLCMI